MADPKYGRERPTPAHVHGHDNPLPVVKVGGVIVTAAWGGNNTSGGKLGPGGLGGLKPVPVGVSLSGEFGKPRPTKKAAKYKA